MECFEGNSGAIMPVLPVCSAAAIILCINSQSLADACPYSSLYAMQEVRSGVDVAGHWSIDKPAQQKV